MIAVWPSDGGGVGWYRLRLPASTLVMGGHRLVELDGIPMRREGAERVAVEIRDDLGIGTLVVQRPTGDWQLVVIRDMQAAGVRVVVDVDDDFHSAPPSNPAFWDTHPRSVSSENRAWLREACRLADLVTVSTPALAARYGAHGRVRVLPNFVPRAWTEVDVEPELDVVGWTGTLGTHRGDLSVTRGGVARAVAGCAARFRVIGQLGGVQREMGLEEAPECVPWQGLETYPLELARLGVGVAPLADSAFNRAKSWLKPLEMAAVGVPCVMSPSDEYRRLHEFGIGVVAKRGRGWEREVRRLLRDVGWRAELSARGRWAVREDLTVEANAWRWLEAWSE